MEEKTQKYKKKIIIESFEKKISELYDNLTYCIENYSKYKFIPYAFSNELVDEIDKVFKNLKELIHLSCVPYEEKSTNYDYLFLNTPLVNKDALFLRRLFQYDNLIDKKTIEKWLTYSGKNLKRKLVELFVKTSKEFKEPFTGIFLFLSLVCVYFISIKKDFMDINFGKVPYDRKDAYFSYFFYFYLKLVLEELSDEIKDEKLFDKLSFDYFSPVIFGEIKTSFLRSFSNFWWISNKEYSIFENLKIYDLFNDSNDFRSLIQNNNELFEEVRKIHICNLVRNEILKNISALYKNNIFFKQLVNIVYSPTQIVKFCFDKDFRSDIYKLAKDLAGKEGFSEAINTFKNDIEKKICETKDISENEYISCAMVGYLAFKSHLLMDQEFSIFLNALKDRRKEKTLDLKEEYENGRLYYFSLDNKKIIQDEKDAKSAVIYIDIRDFSKKTFKLKEQTIVELLKDKFYSPILHYASDKSLSEGIILHNVVGDSIVFSGLIEEILKLAIVVKKDSEDYKSGLEHVIFDDTKKELLAVDLGIFISYGKKPMIFNISSEFGNLNIALGEAINLASRGSKRDFNAKRRLDYIIDYETKFRGVNVKLPFNFYIVEGYNLIMPPTLEHKLLHVKDSVSERQLIISFFEQLKLDITLDESVIFWSKQKFIYNIGIALTDEAFLAFLKVVRVFSDIKKVIINVNQLSEDTQKNYYFRDNEMEFCFVKNRKTGEVFLFRKEGGITFKGYEEETVVWELITKEMPIYNELIKLM